MPRRPRYQRWRPPAWSSIGAALVLVAACSGSGAPDFFTGPPVPHGGTAGNAGKAPGSGGSGDAAGAGDEGGAPDGTGGSGAGEPATGGTAGLGATGGATATGGSAGLAGGGGMLPIGGAGGTAGDTATGGAGGSGGAGGLAGSGGAGTGGADPTAGMAGTGGSVAGTDGLGGMVGVGGKSGCEPTEPADEICDGIDNDCEDGIDDDGACPDGCVGATYDKHRYLLCNGEQTYTRMQAHSLCNDLGDELDVSLDLVRVETEEENEFIVGFLSANPDYHLIWMSATDSTNAGSPREGSWVWGPQDRALLFYDDDDGVVDGMFAYWAEDEPNDGGFGDSEDCGVFDPERDYHWDDRVCSDETEMFLCEQLDD